MVDSHSVSDIEINVSYGKLPQKPSSDSGNSTADESDNYNQNFQDKNNDLDVSGLQESKEQAAAAAYAPIPQEYHRQMQINVENRNKSNSINDSNLEMVEGRGNVQVGESNYDAETREHTFTESTINQEGRLETHVTAAYDLTDADIDNY